MTGSPCCEPCMMVSGASSSATIAQVYHLVHCRHKAAMTLPPAESNMSSISGNPRLPSCKGRTELVAFASQPALWGDEHHILLHCSGFADLRFAHSHLFAQPQQSLLRFFQQPPSQIATFVRAALLQHANMLGSTGGAPGL